MKLFGKTISNQAILATMATIVSVCALVVSLMQTYYQHKYLHAAAWPHLQFEPFRTEAKDTTKNIMEVRLYNKGVGPAIIESVSYQYKGKIYKNIQKLVLYIIEEGSSGKVQYQGSFQALILGGVIAQNEEIVHASIQGATSSRLFNEALPKIKTRIVYSSVHEQRWEYLTSSEYADGQKTNKLN
jgi:hypothetical protein